jgi:hypothetical protein
MFVGIIFSFAQTPSVKYKCIAIGMPYAFLIADIVSWWLTKFFPMFAWLVIFAGMGMAVSFMFMWATSIMEMWLYKPVYVDGIWFHYQQLKAKLAETNYEEKLSGFITIVGRVLRKAKQLADILIEKLAKNPADK